MSKQLPLFPDSQEILEIPPANETPFSGRDIGTFKDSMRAPIHRWFRYPAGYSYKFVFECFELFNLSSGAWVYDPFSGTGTTLICAKQKGIHGYGVEAHSFVHWVANVKLYWEHDFSSLERTLDQLLVQCRQAVHQQFNTAETAGIFPELVYKCYHPDDLKTLYIIREFITREVENKHIQDLLKLALTDTLRGAAAAGTGWPYIAPRKDQQPQRKDTWGVFERTTHQMLSDLFTVESFENTSQICNSLGDSRSRQKLEDEQVQLALTSPPYLNNYDYADRTRLETYFWGIAQSWQDITRQFREKLIVAATTQLTRSHHHVETTLDTTVKEIAPYVYHQLQTAILELSVRRLQKGGKKDYDLMVALYFNDMLRVLHETYRVLQKDGVFCLVLGDSAPYGVHIPTEDMIGQLAVALGFKEYKYHELRGRGGKWKDNPQRHRVPLREGIVVLRK